MTEIIDMRKTPLWPQRLVGLKKIKAPRPVRYGIDPTAFVVALIGAPLLVTALTFWLAFIPVISLALGGPVYLLCAIPVLLWDLPRQEPTFSRLAQLGFLAAMACSVALFLLAVLLQNKHFYNGGALYGVMGAIFGPLWAGPIAPIYLKMRRSDYAQPLA